MKTLKLLKTLNIITSIVIALLAIFIIANPYLPDIILAIDSDQFQGYNYKSPETNKVLGEKANRLPTIPQENRVIIPKIQVDAPINEGDSDVTLDLGIWRRPRSSTPEKGGNTVITGHRFLYTSGPITFYHLDKVEIGDTVIVYWEGMEFVYKVFEIIEVYPNQIEVEFNTIDPIITLYTCTPLWTSEKRLVVKAKLQ